MSHVPDPITVLHVDDEPEFAALSSTYLEREDERFAVETATSADEALDRLADRSIDCIVSDYDMPGTNGIEFLERVREEHSELPFILFTGKGSEEIASEAISAGVTDYLQKRGGTSQYAVLANRITNAVDQYRVRRRVETQKRQYRDLFEQAPFIYVLVRDEDGRPVIEECNERFVETLGYDREEAIGRPMTDFYADPSTEAVYEGGDYERALAGEFEIEERTLVAADGERIDTVLRASPRLDATGDVIGLQTLYLDVTERKERTRRLEMAIEHTDSGVWEYDLGSGTVTRHEGATDLWADDAHTTVRMAEAIETRVHPADRDAVRGALDATVSGGEPYRVEFRHETPDGYRWAEARGELVGEGDAERLIAVTTDVDDRKRREEQLRADRNRLAALFANAPKPMLEGRVEKTEQFSIVDVNAAFTETFGYECDDVVGRDPLDVIVPGEERPEHERLRDRIVAGDSFTAEVERTTVEGDRTLLLDVVSYGTETAPADGWFATYTDITERRRREEELELYETMIETIPDGVYALDEELRYLAVNQGMVELTGYSKEELVGSHVSLVNDEGAVERTKHQRAELVADGIDDGIMIAENTHVTADGEEVPTEARFRALPPGEDGSFRGTAGVIRDVTDRRRRERELERYETIIEASGDPVYTVDADGCLTFVNDAFCELVGYPEADLVGAHVSVVMDDGDIQRGEEVIRTLLETGTERETFEMDLIGAAGERIPCEAHIAVLPFEEEFRGTTGIHRVIADRKRRENALRALHEATGALLRATDEKAVADLAIETARTALDLPICGLWLHDDEADVLRPAAVTEESRDLLGDPPTYTGEGSLSWAAFEEGEHRTYEDLRDVAGKLNSGTSLRSELIIPLGAHGVMNFGSTETGDFDEIDVSLAQVLADTVEAALTRTEWDRTLRRLQHRTETLMRTPTVEETARIAVETAREVLGAELSGFHRLSDDGERLEPLVVADGDEGVLGEGPTYVRGADSDPVSAFVWDVYERGEPTTIEDTGDHERLRGETAAGSGIVHPIDGAGVFIVSSTEPESFDDVDATLTEILVSALRTALDRVERESILRERQHALERQNERLEEFASVVSHDLRNPLNVAEGRLELARETSDSDHLESAASAIDRSLALIEDLLTLAREGRSVSDVEPVPLARLAESCWRHVETADATLVVDTERTIRADRNRLTQLLENLFRNSVEHGSTGNRPEAGDSVEHGSTGSRPGADDSVGDGSTGSRPGADDSVEHSSTGSTAEPYDDGQQWSVGVTITVGDLPDGFYVADDGHGIATDDPDAVFKPGYSTSADGTGFGLSIVTEIAEAHGWEVSATESDEGGARVEITGVETVPGDE